MKKLLYLFALTLFFTSCNQDEMSSKQLASEKNAIEDQIQKLLSGYSAKDIEAVKSVFSASDELIVFGTDAREVFRSLSDWEEQLNNDFQLFESAKFGALQNLSIQISKSGDLAVAFFEAPAEMIFEGQTYPSFFRSARTFKKENDSWLIVQSLSATASEGQSSAELVKQMEEAEIE
jgi:ketosteroid isomerase-like protein